MMGRTGLHAAGTAARVATALVAAGLALATLAAFSGVAGLGFVYDDVDYILQNERVRAGLTADGVRWALGATRSSNWHPLTWVSHMADVSLWGLDAAGHHLTSALIHLVNALLLFLLLRRLTGALWRPALAAAVFAVHPLRVESVAFVAERKDVLSVCLGLLAALAWSRHLARRGRGWYALALGLFALALSAKPMLVTLPLLLLLLDFWPLGRFRGTAGTPARPARALHAPLLEKLPFLLLSAASGVVTLYAQSRGDSIGEGFSWGLRASNALVSGARYLGKALWPRDLAAFYPLPRVAYPGWQVVAAALLALVVTAACWRLRRRAPYLATGWLWFPVALLPVSGLIQVGSQAMADRYTYLPLIGPAFALAWGAAACASRSRARRGIVAVATAAILGLAALAAMTRLQTAFWKDDLTLSRHAMDAVPGNWFMQLKYAAALTERGRGAEAVAHYESALRILPTFAEGHLNLGVLLVDLGRPREAVAHYREAIRSKPEFVAAHMNLANVLSDLGRYEEAHAHYRRALELRPGDADVRFNLAVTLAAQGRRDEAAREFREALRLRPDFPRARAEYSRLLSSGGLP